MDVFKPIIFGSRSKLLHDGTLPEDSTAHTHKWQVFVKGLCDEDISFFVRKVVFKLHDSFENPSRTLEQPPYMLEETGWGEFDIVVKIYFQDPSEKPLSLILPLKLYPTEDTWNDDEGWVVNEYYEEILFHEPSQRMLAILTDTTKRPLPPYNADKNDIFSVKLPQKRKQPNDRFRIIINIIYTCM